MESDISFLMAKWHQYLVWAIVLACLAGAIWLFRWQRRKKEFANRQEFLKGIFEAALEQKASFDIRLRQAESRAGLTATLSSISSKTLDLEIQGFAGDEWDKKKIEVFLRLYRDNEPVFYVFDSIVRSLAREGGSSRLAIAIPAHVRVDRKRYFVRATPNPGAIIMIRVWPVAAGRRLPRANSDLGKPALSWKNGETRADVQVENISGGGIALRFQARNNGEFPFTPEKGKQLICLLVYKDEKGNPVIFWCTGEIMSVRSAGHAVATGLEFTNWAVQEQGNTEIHWTHSSPWQGAKPIINWVKHIEKI